MRQATKRRSEDPQELFSEARHGLRKGRPRLRAQSRRAEILKGSFWRKAVIREEALFMPLTGAGSSFTYGECLAGRGH